MPIQISNDVKVGTVIISGESSIEGYLRCTGSLILRSVYSDLFSVIGTTFGSGDGSTTFAIPDLVGAVPRGAGTSSGYPAESNVTVTLGTKQNDGTQTHQHGLNNSIWVGQGDISSFGASPNNSVVYGGYNYGSLAWGWSTSSLTINNNNGRSANETRMKNVGVNFFIKF